MLKRKFPFEQIRPEQQVAFEHLTPWLEKVLADPQESAFYGADMPTGVGKSPYAIAVAWAVHEFIKNMPPPEREDSDEDDSFSSYVPQVWIVTANKLLQSQYGNDFSELIFDLRGLDNYQCYHDPGKTCGMSRCARLKAPKGVEYSPPEYCGKKCEYDHAMNRARREPVLMLNVAKALTMLKNPRQTPPVFMIFDEGHNVENALDSEAALTITPKELERINYRFEQFFQEPDDIDAINIGLEKLAKQIGQDYEGQIERPVDLRDMPVIKKMENLLRKIGTVLENQKADIQYVPCSQEIIDLRPLKIHQLFQQVFRFPTLFLSATLLSSRGFGSVTGLAKEELDWFSVRSPFPKANRPLINYWRLGSRALNYENMRAEESNVLNRIRDIMRKHPDDRGLIHTHTYNLANAIYEKLGAEFADRFLYPKTAAEQKAALEEHAGRRNTVLISPSMTEGVDLRDDLCRFAIMCKVPYLPINDPVVEARMAADPDWYQYRTAMTIVQAPGRGVRSAEDFCKTYFVDPGFLNFINRARHHFPEWFLESWDRRPQGSY